MTDLIPGVAQARTAGRVALWVVVALVGVLGVLSLASAIADPFGWQKARTDQAIADAAKAKAETAIAEGQAAATQDAADITQAAAGRDAQTIIIREANRAAILAAPGSGVRLDPGLVGAGNHGLCRYAAYTDHPRCAEVWPADPAELPQAGSPVGPSTP